MWSSRTDTHTQSFLSTGTYFNGETSSGPAYSVTAKATREASVQILPILKKLPLPRSATVAGCIFNLLATIMGAGLLVLPYAMAGCGVWIGFLSFTLIMILSTISYVNLSKAIKLCGNDCDFMKLAKYSLPGWLYQIVDFCVFINGFGCAAGYLMVMSTFMPEVIKSFSPNVDEWLCNRQLWCAAFAILAFPLLLLKNLDSLKFTSFLVVIFVLYSVGTMIYYSMYPPNWEYKPEVQIGLPGDTVQFMKVFAIIVNAFACSQNVPRIVNTLVNPTQKRLNFVILASTTICLVMYIGAGYIGYSTFGDRVEPNILTNYPSGLLLINIARLSITLSLAGSYPVQLHPARNSLSIIMAGVPAENLRPHWYFLLTTVIWGGTLATAMITDNLGTISTFIGALAAVPLTFIYPNLFWVQVNRKLFPEQSVSYAWLISILGVIFIPISILTEVWKLYAGDE